MTSNTQIREGFYYYVCENLKNYPIEKEDFIKIWNTDNILVAHAYFLKFVHDKLPVSLLEKEEYQRFFAAFVY